jgi:hypothetical protein
MHIPLEFDERYVSSQASNEPRMFARRWSIYMISTTERDRDPMPRLLAGLESRRGMVTDDRHETCYDDH